MEKHQAVAVLIFILVITFVGYRDGYEIAIEQGIILIQPLLAIIFYRLIARLSGIGFPECFAKDYGSENKSGPYAFFFWLLFIIVCLFIVFKWSLYN